MDSPLPALDPTEPFRLCARRARRALRRGSPLRRALLLGAALLLLRSASAGAVDVARAMTGAAVAHGVQPD